MKNYHNVMTGGKISHLHILAHVDSPSFPYTAFNILATFQL